MRFATLSILLLSACDDPIRPDYLTIESALAAPLVVMHEVPELITECAVPASVTPDIENDESMVVFRMRGQVIGLDGESDEVVDVALSGAGAADDAVENFKATGFPATLRLHIDPEFTAAAQSDCFPAGTVFHARTMRDGSLMSVALVAAQDEEQMCLLTATAWKRDPWCNVGHTKFISRDAWEERIASLED